MNIHTYGWLAMGQEYNEKECFTSTYHPSCMACLWVLLVHTLAELFCEWTLQINTETEKFKNISCNQ
jgi:hypothetical protein